MATIRKSDIVEKLGNVGFTKKDANLAIDTVLESIEESIANGNDVKLTGFGNFTTYRRGASKRNVFGEEHYIEAATLPKFKAGKRLRDAAALS